VGVSSSQILPHNHRSQAISNVFSQRPVYFPRHRVLVQYLLPIFWPRPDFRRPIGFVCTTEEVLLLPAIIRYLCNLDSFLYQHGVHHPSFQLLIGFQISDGYKHPLSLKGLRQLQKSLKPKVAELKALRPSPRKKTIILFVVPAPMGASFSKQPFKEKAEDLNWDAKTAQFVLELDPDVVWKSQQ
jgi:hypothetical protein